MNKNELKKSALALCALGYDVVLHKHGRGDWTAHVGYEGRNVGDVETLSDVAYLVADLPPKGTRGDMSVA